MEGISQHQDTLQEEEDPNLGPMDTTTQETPGKKEYVDQFEVQTKAITAKVEGFTKEGVVELFYAINSEIMDIGEKLDHLDQSDLPEDYRAKIPEIIRELRQSRASLADQTNMLQGIIPFRCEPGVISYLFTGEGSVYSESTVGSMEDPGHRTLD